MYPARNGDAFLIRSSGRNILVDCGYASTYQQFVADDLLEISASGERLDLIVVTHIDADHIGGLIELLDANGPHTPRRVVEIDDIWHNSLRCLLATNNETVPLPEKALLNRNGTYLSLHGGEDGGKCLKRKGGG
jgi:glyoxylase-like metal-dependent hydrolase (beta-lactamase superfamily II)